MHRGSNGFTKNNFPYILDTQTEKHTISNIIDLVTRNAPTYSFVIFDCITSRLYSRISNSTRDSCVVYKISDSFIHVSV